MNREYLNLGKELVEKVTDTWSNLEYLNYSIMKNSILESIGKEVYENKDIFNDYLYYKYELAEYYKSRGKAFTGKWMIEWWSDGRGDKFQRTTFCDLANIVIDAITSDEGGWYYDEKNDYYLPKGTHFNSKKYSVVYDFNNNIEVNFDNLTE